MNNLFFEMNLTAPSPQGEGWGEAKNLSHEHR